MVSSSKLLTFEEVAKHNHTYREDHTNSGIGSSFQVSTFYHSGYWIRDNSIYLQAVFGNDEAFDDNGGQGNGNGERSSYMYVCITCKANYPKLVRRDSKYSQVLITEMHNPNHHQLNNILSINNSRHGFRKGGQRTWHVKLLGVSKARKV